jgi:hypothetical protein
MSSPNHKDEENIVERFTGSLMILMFGVGSLAFLVAIERPHWFHIRPASGAAAAMAYAAEPPTMQSDRGE